MRPIQNRKKGLDRLYRIAKEGEARGNEEGEGERRRGKGTGRDDEEGEGEEGSWKRLMFALNASRASEQKIIGSRDSRDE
jgi:hypothetical protein